MKVIFWTREEVGVKAASDERETDLAKAIQDGARVHGDEVEIRVAPTAYPEPIHIIPADLVCLCGVKSRYWFRAYANRHIPWLYFDKGYIRERAEVNWLSYWRMSVNCHHPVDFLARAGKDRTRADIMRFSYEPWRQKRGKFIVLDGGSEKNFKFNAIVPESAGIHDVERHCRKLIAQIREIAPGRPIIYRPKPSSPERHGIVGTEFAYKTRPGVEKKDWEHDVERAHVVVTYASALSYEAHRIGIPSIVLGNAPTRPIMSTSLEDIEHPRLASDAERRQWLNNLAWCQFKLAEHRSGLSWPVVKEMLACTPL